MIVVAFDIATHLGWALFCRGAHFQSGMIDFSPRRGEHSGARYLRLARWLDAEIKTLVCNLATDKDSSHQPQVTVALEDVQSHVQRNKVTGVKTFGTTAAHVYGGLRAIIEAWACSRGYPVFPLGVGSWKSAIGCKGGSHASKDEVMRMIRILGFSPRSQDEADAIGVGFAASSAVAWQAKIGAFPASASVTIKKRNQTKHSTRSK